MSPPSTLLLNIWSRALLHYYPWTGRRDWTIHATPTPSPIWEVKPSARPYHWPNRDLSTPTILNNHKTVLRRYLPRPLREALNKLVITYLLAGRASSLFWTSIFIKKQHFLRLPLPARLGDPRQTNSRTPGVKEIQKVHFHQITLHTTESPNADLLPSPRLQISAPSDLTATASDILYR